MERITPKAFNGSAVLFLVAVVGLASTLAAFQVGSEKPSQFGVSAEAVPQAALPIKLSEAGVHCNIVTRECALEYTLQNGAKEPLQEYILLVLMFDSGGTVRGGQRSYQKSDLTAGAEQHMELRLSNLLYVDQAEQYRRFVVGIESARAGDLEWNQSLSKTDLIAAMKEGKAVPAKESSVCGPDPCPENFCPTCFEWAQQACGLCGVKSWSCTINGSCQCSFTCRNSGPGCPEGP